MVTWPINTSTDPELTISDQASLYTCGAVVTGKAPFVKRLPGIHSWTGSLSHSHLWGQLLSGASTVFELPPCIQVHSLSALQARGPWQTVWNTCEETRDKGSMRTPSTSLMTSCQHSLLINTDKARNSKHRNNTNDSTIPSSHTALMCTPSYCKATVAALSGTLHFSTASKQLSTETLSRPHVQFHESKMQLSHLVMLRFPNFDFRSISIRFLAQNDDFDSIQF